MSSTAPLTGAAVNIDGSGRLAQSSVVVASPAGASETIICSVTIPSGLAFTAGVILAGWAALTVGTSGTAVTLKLRKTNVSGSTVQTTGALNATAAQLVTRGILGFDATPTEGGVYVLTLTVANGAATSTVSAAQLFAVAI
jgi:hypothetical protein